LPCTGVLHVRLVYAAIGSSDAVEQENPKEPGMQVVTVGSGPQLFGDDAAARQQKSVEPAFPWTPTLHSRVESESSGVSEPVHEYPVESPLQPATVESGAHVLPESSVPAEALAVQPARTAVINRDDRTSSAFRPFIPSSFRWVSCSQ